MCRKHVFEEFQYDPQFTLAQDYHFFARALSKFQGANLPDILVHYRFHSANSHKKNKKSHLSFIEQIHNILLESFQIIDPQIDLSTLMLITDSNPSILGKEELTQIDHFLKRFKTHCLDKKIILPEKIDKVISRVWKECYWKIEKNTLYFYSKYVFKHKAWRYFTPSDLKFFLKEINKS